MQEVFAWCVYMHMHAYIHNIVNYIEDDDSINFCGSTPKLYVCMVAGRQYIINVSLRLALFIGNDCGSKMEPGCGKRENK